MFRRQAAPSPLFHGGACPAPAPERLYAEEPPAPPLHEHEQQPVGLKATPACVLVVDDAPDILYLVSTFFKLSGYEVETADTAFAAFGAARRRRFDAVVSDIGMPGMSGYDLASALRTLPGYDRVPLVAVTGFAEYGDVEQARRAGFDAHLKKPLDLSRLAELVEGMRPA